MIKKFNVEKTKNMKMISKLLSLNKKKPICRFSGQLLDVKNVLIVDFALIGDMVMNIPFLKAIRQNCPKTQITMVCMPWAETILGNQELVDRFIIFDGKNKLSTPMCWIKNARKIRWVLRIINHTEYEIGFEPKGDFRHMLFLHYTNCKKTISYNYTGGEKLVTDCFEPIEESQHLIDEKLELLRFAGFDISNISRIPQLRLNDKSKEFVNKYKKNILDGRLVIGVHPGASTENKRFKNYPKLTNKIIEKYGDRFQFVIFSGPTDINEVSKIENVLILNNAKYAVIKEKLDDYVKLVSVCNFMICNDSAAAHIAAAYNVPCLVIFGSTIPQTGLARGKCNVECVSKEMNCKPCTLPQCYKNNECIDNIDINQLVDKLDDLIRKSIKGVN